MFKFESVDDGRTDGGSLVFYKLTFSVHRRRQLLHVNVLFLLSIDMSIVSVHQDQFRFSDALWVFTYEPDTKASTEYRVYPANSDQPSNTGKQMSFCCRHEEAVSHFRPIPSAKPRLCRLRGCAG